jgi:hypothetical protein
MSEWRPIETAPARIWLRTKREGENGENVCAKNVSPDGDVEWVERGPYGRTTVTHHSFAAPTHWLPLVPSK